jgi:uncharacterized membrane protein
MRSHVSARTRLLLVIAAGLPATAVAIFLTPWQVAALVGWDFAAAVFLVWVWWSIWPLDGDQTAIISTIEDDSRSAADVILISASVVSLVGVGFALLKAAHETGAAQGIITGVAVLSVALSWLAVHTVFTLRYANLYHHEGKGIDFKEEDLRPSYRDFAYTAFTVGMTFQVSDTDVTSVAIRRAVLRHALLAYLFGIVIVAITINVVASLLK